MINIISNKIYIEYFYPLKAKQIPLYLKKCNQNTKAMTKDY